MPNELLNTIANIFTAIGTVAVAILALWGDQIRDWLLGPRLKLSLVDPKGDLAVRTGGGRVYFYHLKVKNSGRTAASGVRVHMRAFSRRTPAGNFIAEPLVYPLQLVWTPKSLGETERTIVDESTCDFGFLGETDNCFWIAALVAPNNFNGVVERNACVRFKLVATGVNILSRFPTILQVSWDGVWTGNQEEMQRHLIIERVPDLLKP
jgi:hypothetical protein